MARYEASSVEFGERLKEERKREQQKIAKEQESFAKKIAGAQFVVKGINTYLDDRAEKFNASLADEKAFLKTTQGNATSFLNTHKSNVIDKNKSVREYLDEINTESMQSLVEKHVNGFITQVPDKDGNIVERVAFNLPKTSFRNLPEYKIGEQTFDTYDKFLDAQVDNYNKVLNHAKSVPATSQEVDEYLKQYSKEQIPTNIFSFVTRGARRIIKGETPETLKEKINKSTNTILNDERFANFKNFSNSLNAYNKQFPNRFTDSVKEFADSIEIKNGEIVDKRINKIVSDVDVNFTTGTSTSVDAATNKKITTTVAIPVMKKTYVDGQVETSQGDSFEITSGEDLLVVYNSAVQNTMNSSLTQIGQKAWFSWANDPENKVAENPFASFAAFLETDTENQFLKPDMDPSVMFDIFTKNIGTDITKTYLPPDKSQYETEEEYVKAMEEHNKRAAELIGSMFDTFYEGANLALSKYPQALKEAN